MNPGAAIHQSAKKCCAKLDATIFTVQTATVNSALRGHRRLFPNLLDYGGGGAPSVPQFIGLWWGWGGPLSVPQFDRFAQNMCS